MLFINEYEIDELLRRFDEEETPNLVKGAKVLDGLCQWTNSNSDGWPYWKKPLQAATKLMTLLQAAERFDPKDCTDAELRATLTPIKSFLTKQGVEHYVVGIGEAPPAPQPAALLMSEDLHAYKRNEIQDVLDAGPHPDEDWFRLQVRGVTASKHLNITRAQLEAIRDTIAPKPLPTHPSGYRYEVRSKRTGEVSFQTNDAAAAKGFGFGLDPDLEVVDAADNSTEVGDD